MEITSISLQLMAGNLNSNYLKMYHLGLIIRLFSVFSNKQYNFYEQIKVKKCPFSIQCGDSNLRPLEHKSSLMTISAGLPL